MYRDQAPDKNKNHNNNLQELIVETTNDNYNIMDRHNEEEENGDSLRLTVTPGGQPDDDPPIPARQPNSTPAAVHHGASEPPGPLNLRPDLGFKPSFLEDPIPDFHFNLGTEHLHENPDPKTSDKSPTVAEPPVPARQPHSTPAAVHDRASEPPLEPLNIGPDLGLKSGFFEDPIPDLGSEPLHENPNHETSDKSPTVAEPPFPTRQHDADEPPIPVSQPDADGPPIPTRQPERTSEFPELFYQLKHLNPNLEEELRRRRNCRCKTSLRGRKSKPKKSSALGVQKLSVQSLPVRRRRSNPKRGLRPDKCPTVNPPYPWATDRRATVHTMAELDSRGISTVVGNVQCKKCEKTFEVEYDLKAEAGKLIGFMAEKKGLLLERSAPEWDTPAWRDCILCGGKKCVKGVVSRKKRSINWLFLFLGGFLCCCTIQQLKYFCKHTGNHRTGAKNRLLYLTYLGLCKQLDPSGPFNPPSI